MGAPGEGKNKYRTRHLTPVAGLDISDAVRLRVEALLAAKKKVVAHVVALGSFVPVGQACAWFRLELKERGFSLLSRNEIQPWEKGVLMDTSPVGSALAENLGSDAPADLSQRARETSPQAVRDRLKRSNAKTIKDLSFQREADLDQRRSRIALAAQEIDARKGADPKPETPQDRSNAKTLDLSSEEIKRYVQLASRDAARSKGRRVILPRD